MGIRIKGVSREGDIWRKYQISILTPQIGPGLLVIVVVMVASFGSNVLGPDKGAVGVELRCVGMNGKVKVCVVVVC